MVYVFLVDAGIMWTFDVSYALKSVSHLAQAIEKACGIPIEKQVLIVSGGESLDPNNRVCVYSAGTDTNPFFLFRRIDYECGPPSYDVEGVHDVDMRQELEKAIKLEPNYVTVGIRAELAKKFYELAIEQINICKQLVHEQHLQQQGWAASLANMDDCVIGVQRNLDYVEKTVRNHVSKIDHYKNLLATFNEVLEKLSQVPLPQALLVGGGAFMEDLITSLRSAGKGGIADEVASPPLPNDDSRTSFERKETFGKTETEAPEPSSPSGEEPMIVSKKSGSSGSLNVDMSLKGEMEASLLQWIHHHDEKGTMKLLVDNCERGLRQFGEDLLEELNGERERLMADLHIPNVKEIKGLEGRLCALEQFMHQAKNLVDEQSGLSQSFSLNQDRCCNLIADDSIFPDLSLLHIKQLMVMHENHVKIQDIRRRCTNAKTELCTSLFHRLKWIVYVESRIAQLSCKLTIMNEGLKRMELNLELLSELHAAPQKYLMAVGEVVRRRTFSSAFLKWGQALSTQMQSIYNEEMARRKEFDNNFEDHFVRLMFPGLADCPLPFATEPPRPFDSDLPKLSLSDLEMIRSKLPDVAKVVPAPEIRDTMSHLMSVVATCVETEDKVKPLKSDDQQSADRGINQTDPETGVQPLKVRRIVPTSSVPQLKDDRGFESETDTEEFEKVGQSPVDLVFGDRQPRAASSASGNTVEVGVQCHGSQDVAVQCSPLSFRPRSRSAMLACAGSSLQAGVQCRSMDSSFSLCDDIPRGSFVDTGVQVVKGAPSTPSTDSGIQCDAFRSSPVLNRSCPAVLSTRCEIGIQCGEAFLFGFSSHDHFRVHDKLSSVSFSKEADVEDVQELAPVRIDDVRVNMRELGRAAASLVHLLRSDLVELRQKVDAEGKKIPAMLNEFRASWDVIQAFIKGQSSIEPPPSTTEEEETTVTDTTQPTNEENRVAELEKLLEEYRKRQEDLQEQLLQRNAKDDDFKRVTGELERRLEDVEKYRAHCDELQRRLDDNLEKRTWEANQEMESSYQDQMQQLEEEKRALTEKTARLTVDKENLIREVETLQVFLLTAEGEKNLALEEQAAKLSQEHRAEVASLRSRFILMTKSSMERSPSESSLEGAEKLDSTDMSKETIAALSEKMRKEKEIKIREAVQATRMEMEAKMKAELKSMQMKMEAEKQVWFTDAMRRIMAEREQRISSLMDSESRLKMECSKLWKTIHSISGSNSSVDGGDHLAGSKIIAESGKFSPLTVSEIENFHRTLSRSTCTFLQRSIKTTSCMPGDVVQVVWNEDHSNYMVLQRKDVMYFVHHDSLAALGLPERKTEGVIPFPTSCLAAVVDKEYCHARKVNDISRSLELQNIQQGNRFLVERGTKFYRVKLAPLKSELLVTTASQCDPQALTYSERSENQTQDLSLSITGSGPSSAISDDEPPQEAPKMPS